MTTLVQALRRWWVAPRHRGNPPPALEELEGRALPSALGPLSQPLGGPAIISSGPGYTPDHVRHAYGFDRVQFARSSTTPDGSGQTIAIVTAYDYANLVADLAVFDKAAFGKIVEQAKASLGA